MVKVRIELELSSDELEKLVSRSISLGFMREKPRKAWTDNERKEAVRYLVKRTLR